MPTLRLDDLDDEEDDDDDEDDEDRDEDEDEDDDDEEEDDEEEETWQVMGLFPVSGTDYLTSAAEAPRLSRVSS